ncbi:DUF1203 domain-containing protein [Ornithinimicrobium sp. F0845]|uniref:DUF1203 domain-containing protein n=1 Tax=Ornithinimicrobium sp. F0845 TaxID=2926412 RepID=UPI001FF51044|nr:DUF1203 domain-containing protein [Ornithinimicrobium sp. F0845]MCK0113330.1 DUF1203 domain-containing protein [Ornithinimicrobium sp. F0845]
MTSYRIESIRPEALASVHRDGVEVLGNHVAAFDDTTGREQLRCCLRLSRPGGRIVLIAHAPLSAHNPWREVGPVYVHAARCAGWTPSAAVPEWFDDAPRVLRAYTSEPAMHHPANRVVAAGEGVAGALEAIFADPDVTQVHVRNLLAQCFVAKAVRR